MTCPVTGFSQYYGTGALALVLGLAGCTSATPPIIQYQLASGETFRITARTTRTVSLEYRDRRLPFRIRPHDVEVGFSIDCRVTAFDEPEISRIEGKLTDVEVRAAWDSNALEYDGKTRKLRIKTSESEWREMPLKNLGLGLIPRPLLSLVLVREAGFTVDKTLPGKILRTQGGEEIRQALGGISIASALSWFGATFPSRPIELGQTWRETDQLELSQDFLQFYYVRFHHPVEVQYTYRYRGEGFFPGVRGEGLRQPIIDVAMKFQGNSEIEAPETGVRPISTAKRPPWRMVSEGQGTGEIRVDPINGKISRSIRSADLRLRLVEQSTGTIRAALKVHLESDAWHEHAP